MLHTKKISNRKDFPDVGRSINIIGIMMNSELSIFDIYYKISHVKNGEDVSHIFNQQNPSWSINNQQTMMVRDPDFNPIPNPEFEEKLDDDGNISNEDQRFMTMPAFDYIKKLMFDTSESMEDILSAYIAEEDKEGRFNF